MKKYILVLFIAGAFMTSARAQNPLANTSWQGQAKIPDATDVLFQFKNDSVYMYMLPNMVIVETMIYTTKDSTFTWRKVSGRSPCDPSTTGTYKFAIAGDELKLTVVSDDCPARREADIGKPFKKAVLPR